MAQAVHLYRRVAREIPRLVTIYDLPHTPRQIRAGIAAQFRHYADIEDERVVAMLVSKGEMELEESLMQWKQKTHVVRLIESFCGEEVARAEVPWLVKGRAFLEKFHKSSQELLFSTFWGRT